MQPETNKKEEFLQALGKVMSRLHDESKLSARSIAYGINISKTTLLLAKDGKLDMQMSTFCKLAEAFYIKPEDLLKLIYEELPENWSFLE